MLKWLADLSRRTSAKNIVEELRLLVQTTMAAEQRWAATGRLDPVDRDAVIHRQKKLLFELHGPLPLSQVKVDFFDPVLNHPDITPGAKEAVAHVFNTARERRSD
jgi:hypothetical protein